jgi:hypothetical protein
MTALERVDFDEIERGIIEALEASSPYPPRALLDELREQGFDENSIRAAIWFLVDRRRLDFTPQRELVLVRSSAATNGRAS